MEIDYKIMGLTIKKIRKSKHITQQELSKMINKTVTHISKIEQGKTKAGLQTLVDIANCLNVSIEDILNGFIYKTQKSIIEKEYEELFKNCSIKEQKFLMENLKYLKYQLKELKE